MLTSLLNLFAVLQKRTSSLFIPILLIPLFIIDGLGAVQQNITQYTDVYIGTDQGITPCAEVPFGMIQIGPDGDSVAWNYNYSYSTTFINDFSLTHINGAGTCGKGHLQFMATTGSLSDSPGPYWNRYGSSFSRSTETVTPGFYGVTLAKYNTKVELTTTTRTGFARFTFPSTTQANILFNVVRSNSKGNNGALYMEHSGSIAIVGNNQVTGCEIAPAVGITPIIYPIYFAVEFDQPFTSFGTWKGNTITAESSSDSGEQAGGYVTFDVTATPVVQMKIAISYVSLANAKENLATEIPGWDFDKVRTAADSIWNSVLGKVQITGGDNEDLRKFYAGLYHCYLHPNAASDVNGEYVGFDDNKHVASDFTVYQTYSGWDIFRSWIQVISIFAPETRDIVKSLIVDAQQGEGFPQWSDQNREMRIMVGDPSVTMIATAYALGVRGFDYTEALTLMDLSAMDPDRSVRDNVTEYARLGYRAENAAITQDYAGVDFAISRFAAAIKDWEKAEFYGERGQWWKNNFNTGTGYLQARTRDGSWLTPWSPTTTRGYIEDNATVYTWLVPYNLQDLFDMMGGIDEVIPRLDDFFTKLRSSPSEPYLAMGNEPSFSQPFLYNSVQQPWKSQDVVRRVMQEEFRAGPRAYPGDDDLGSMSSWLVWAYLGMYPAYPGMDIMVLVGPYFPSIALTTAQGKTVRITAAGAGPDAPYIQSLKVNGVATTKSWIRWSYIADNGTLEYVMGSTPNTGWGSNPDDVPPSFDENSTAIGSEPENRPFPSQQFIIDNVCHSAIPGVLSIDYHVPYESVDYVRMTVYNLSGRCIFSSDLSRELSSEQGRVSIDLRKGSGRGVVGSGVCFVNISYKLKGEMKEKVYNQKIILLK